MHPCFVEMVVKDSVGKIMDTDSFPKILVEIHLRSVLHQLQHLKHWWKMRIIDFLRDVFREINENVFVYLRKMVLIKLFVYHPMRIKGCMMIVNFPT